MKKFSWTDTNVLDDDACSKIFDIARVMARHALNAPPRSEARNGLVGGAVSLLQHLVEDEVEHSTGVYWDSKLLICELLVRYTVSWDLAAKVWNSIYEATDAPTTIRLKTILLQAECLLNQGRTVEAQEVLQYFDTISKAELNDKFVDLDLRDAYKALDAELKALMDKSSVEEVNALIIEQFPKLMGIGTSDSPAMASYMLFKRFSAAFQRGLESSDAELVKQYAEIDWKKVAWRGDICTFGKNLTIWWWTLSEQKILGGIAASLVCHAQEGPVSTYTKKQLADLSNLDAEHGVCSTIRSVQWFYSSSILRARCLQLSNDTSKTRFDLNPGLRAFFNAIAAQENGDFHEARELYRKASFVNSALRRAAALNMLCMDPKNEAINSYISKAIDEGDAPTERVYWLIRALALKSETPVQEYQELCEKLYTHSNSSPFQDSLIKALCETIHRVDNRSRVQCLEEAAADLEALGRMSWLPLIAHKLQKVSAFD